jgi:hypothetical protein
MVSQTLKEFVLIIFFVATLTVCSICLYKSVQIEKKVQAIPSFPPPKTPSGDGEARVEGNVKTEGKEEKSLLLYDFDANDGFVARAQVVAKVFRQDTLEDIVAWTFRFVAGGKEDDIPEDIQIIEQHAKSTPSALSVPKVLIRDTNVIIRVNGLDDRRVEWIGDLEILGV